jgi:ribose transport system substrate-binding protein
MTRDKGSDSNFAGNSTWTRLFRNSNLTPFWSLTPFVLALMSCAPKGETAADSATAANKPLTIAVIPKGTTHEFWKAIHAGAVQAQRELSAQGAPVQIIWKGPLREDDRELQVQVVEGFTAQRVQGIVLAPLDNRALVRPVEEAKRAGVPTVIIDSGLESDSIVSFVATDNLQGGRLAADHLGGLLGGKGKVMLLRYAEGSASTTAREQGFLEEMRVKYPTMNVVSTNQYAGVTRETAKRASENLLNRYGNEIQGIFTVNETSTIGMLLALQDMKKAGKIKFIGFDASPILLDAMRAGQLNGIVVQNPMRMGYLGVKTMVDHLRGKPVDRRVDTGVTMVTPTNLDSAAVKDLVSPPVAKYLKEP